MSALQQRGHSGPDPLSHLPSAIGSLAGAATLSGGPWLKRLERLRGSQNAIIRSADT